MEEKLIECVRQRPELYDKRRSDYRDVMKKKIAWADIAHKMQTPAAECKRKWKVLRDRYTRVKKGEQRTNGSQEGGSGIEWEMLPRLTFLGDFVKHRRNTTNISTTPDTLCDETQQNAELQQSVPMFYEESQNPEQEVIPEPPFEYIAATPSPDLSSATSCTTVFNNSNGENTVPRKKTTSKRTTDDIDDLIMEALRMPNGPEESFANMVAHRLRKLKRKEKNEAMTEILAILNEKEERYGDEYM